LFDSSTSGISQYHVSVIAVSWGRRQLSLSEPHLLHNIHSVACKSAELDSTGVGRLQFCVTVSLLVQSFAFLVSKQEKCETCIGLIESLDRHDLCLLFPPNVTMIKYHENRKSASVGQYDYYHSCLNAHLHSCQHL
jgi:hypothetical protein